MNFTYMDGENGMREVTLVIDEVEKLRDDPIIGFHLSIKIDTFIYQKYISIDEGEIKGLISCLFDYQKDHEKNDLEWGHIEGDISIRFSQEFNEITLFVPFTPSGIFSSGFYFTLDEDDYILLAEYFKWVLEL